MTVLLALAGCADDPQRRVWLDFSDGTHGVAFAEEDDATRLVSRLCEAEGFAPFRAPATCGGGDRERCVEEVLAEVEDRFAGYDVAFTASRPEEGPYSAVIVAPPVAACSFGQRGVAFVDCLDENPSNLGFAFDCYGDAASCAVLVAHEVAHGFGLVHVLDATDIMTLGPEDPALRFRDAAFVAGENDCGVTSQSSQRVLEQRLGTW